MSEEILNKEKKVETEKKISPTSTNKDSSFEFNSYNAFSNDILSSLFACGIYNYFTKEEIDNVLKNPIHNHETAIKLSNFVYTKNGIVSNSIDYMTALPCLDRVLISKAKKKTNKTQTNKDLMKATLESIHDKQFIRNALFTEMTDGIAFFYFETKKRKSLFDKYMTDYDVENIVEINEAGVNVAIITLPWEYTKIVGKKNSRYVLAFDLRYFDDFTGDTQKRKLKKYPLEIVEAYEKRRKNPTIFGNWVVLDNDKTMCRKIKCKDTEPWGRSLVIAALSDVLYKDYFTDTKRNVLDEINNRVIYETFPEGKDKGSCSLTKSQQEHQHNTVKNAIMNKNSKGGISFFSVASGTKLNSIDVSTDIFDEKNESDLNNQISLDLGICASLIGATTTGNFSASVNNLEMINAQIYTWVSEWQDELNHVINHNIIQDKKNKVEVYYFPTSFVNRKSFYEMMKGLYDVGGSLSYLVASTGVDVESYFAVLNDEIDNKIYEKYLPHLTNATISKEDKVTGRPSVDNPTNENTISSKSNNTNDIPKPSTR